MIVRCGKCRAELEVAGVGEFVCPRCGTRNAVRGAPAPSPFDLGSIAPTPPPSQQESQATWVTCPECSWRFVIGAGVSEVVCPTCRSALEVEDGAARPAAEQS